MKKHKSRTPKHGQDANPEESPQVFAVSKEPQGVKFSRRDFLQVATAAAAAVTLSNCAPPAAPPPADTATPKPPTKTPTPTRTPTSTPTLTFTPTPLPHAIVKGACNVRFGPGTNSRVVGQLKGKDEVVILGRNDDGSWLRIKKEGGADGWVKATLVDLSSGPVEDLQIVTPIPTPTPLPGKPGKTGAGKTGIDYTFTDESGNTVTYTMPCGSPLPKGAVCVCNCVTVPAPCPCQKYHAPCTCNRQGGHYWYPN